MRIQYRVTWKREGNRPKAKRVKGLPNAERWVGILTSPEPWKFLKDFEDKGPDDYWCCAGTAYDECGCGGITVREFCDSKREGLPPIEYVRIQLRRVHPWGTLEVESTVERGK